MAGQLFDESNWLVYGLKLDHTYTALAITQLVNATTLTRLRVDGISIANDGATANVARLYVTNGGVDYLVGSVSVPAHAGEAGNATVFLTSIFDTLPFTVYATSQNIIKVSLETQPGVGETVHFMAFVGVV